MTKTPEINAAERRRTFIALTITIQVVAFSILFYVLTGRIGLGLGATSRIHGWLFPPPPTAAGACLITPAHRVNVADPDLGYVQSPGTYAGTQLLSNGQTIAFAATILPDHTRATSTIPHSGPAVWVCGCSFVWGTWLSDSETMPWMVQTAAPTIHVVNKGQSGYGEVHALIQLRDAIASGETLPATLVVCYCDFHQMRNVGAPSFLGSIRAATARIASTFDVDSLGYARAWLDDGSLRTEVVPFDWHAGQHDPSKAEQVRVTQAILGETLALCREHGIRPVLAFQAGPDDDAVIASAKGWQVVDIRHAGLTLFDGHPSPAGNRAYAAALVPAVTR